MIKKLFKKEHSNTTFFQELSKKELDEKWLKDGLKSDFIDINHQDLEGNTFLIKCLKTSKFQAAQWLIHNGADITIKNNEGKTAINIAIEKNNLAIVKELLDLGKIDVNQKDINGRSLLQNVVVWGNNKMAKLLINCGADVNNIDNHGRNVLYDALSYGDQQFIRYLLALDNIELNYVDEAGNTLMQHPEVLKNDSIAKDLLIAGVDPTIQTKNGDSYLLKTALRGEEAEDIIDIALVHGANVNSKTHKDKTIMMELISTAAENETLRESLLRTSKKMLEYNGDINALEENNETGLFNAIRMKDFELTSFLLSGGIDPNIQNDHGETALEILIYDGVENLDFILLLIAYEANPCIKNKHGKTIYELLNDIILHLHGTKIIKDETLIQKINPKGQYLTILNELLERNENEEDLNFLDSTGDPLFFKPLLYDYFSLFKLYIKYGLNIHAKNKANHSIFFEYVLKVFEDDIADSKTCENFQHNLSSLLSSKVEKNYQDALGWTVLHKIVGTNCNEKLFDILTKVVLFDYSLTDNLGRSVIHNAVWGNKKNIIKKIALISRDTINIADAYNVLPITYAALLGNKDLVLLFLDLESNVSASKPIAPQAIKKFTPMLKNLEKLTLDVKDPSLLQKLNIVIDQVKRDFSTH